MIRVKQAGEIMVVFNADEYQCSIDSLLHELGHSMGLAATGENKPAPGMPDCKKTDKPEDIDDYKFNGTKGHVYEGHGHVGQHCAYGMSDEDKGKNPYWINSPKIHSNGTCIMFGEGKRKGASLATSGFCPQCRDHAKARDLSDLSKFYKKKLTRGTP